MARVFIIFCFQDNVEDERDIEEGEEVIENEEENLICSLRESNNEVNTINRESELLIPDLQCEKNQEEPNYDDLDNLTLLSSLCIQSDPQNNTLLPELD